MAKKKTTAKGGGGSNKKNKGVSNGINSAPDGIGQQRRRQMPQRECRSNNGKKRRNKGKGGSGSGFDTLAYNAADDYRLRQAVEGGECIAPLPIFVNRQYTIAR